MASLQVRELPENIYSLLKQRAEAEHRSIAQEAILLLVKKDLIRQLIIKNVVPVCYKKSRRKLD